MPTQTWPPPSLRSRRLEVVAEGKNSATQASFLLNTRKFRLRTHTYPPREGLHLFPTDSLTVINSSLKSMVGARASTFFKHYRSNKGLKTALHARDLVELCHTLPVVRQTQTGDWLYLKPVRPYCCLLAWRTLGSFPVKKVTLPAGNYSTSCFSYLE